MKLRFRHYITHIHKSHHCEVAVCFDIDENEECFTYMLGVGVDEADAGIVQRPGTFRYDIHSGLYARIYYAEGP